MNGDAELVELIGASRFGVESALFLDPLFSGMGSGGIVCGIVVESLSVGG